MKMKCPHETDVRSEAYGIACLILRLSPPELLRLIVPAFGFHSSSNQYRISHSGCNLQHKGKGTFTFHITIPTARGTLYSFQAINICLCLFGLIDQLLRLECILCNVRRELICGILCYGRCKESTFISSEGDGLHFNSYRKSSDVLITSSLRLTSIYTPLDTY